MGGAFLFSVDLEDVRTMIPNGSRYRNAVPAMTQRFLDVLEETGCHCTFFTVGNVARQHPELIREIQSRGHELACHTREHEPLDRQTPESFKRDLAGNIEDLMRAGADTPIGFRAPVASLTPETSWAHSVMAECGIRYSSSVVPAKTPLYGWPGFAEGPQRIGESGNDLWELPLSLLSLPGMRVAFCGGIYLRLLPFALVRWAARRSIAQGTPVVGYLHPYDIDTEQERFMHPELGESRIYNALMYANRGRALARVASMLQEHPVSTYRDYVAELDAAGTAP